MNSFSLFNPAVSAFYLISVITITMFSSNPLLTLISLVCGITLYCLIKESKRRKWEWAIYIVFFIIISLTNPLFSHNGVTVLFFINDNPITLESLLYGAHLAAVMIAAIFWFKCLNIILNEEKLLYLVGSVAPKIALLISSALRFLPIIKNQAEKTKNSQKTLGIYAGDVWTDKLKNSLRVYSALVSWSLENAVDTGISMKARGYGLTPKSHYSIYKFKLRDFFLSSIILLLDIAVCAALSLKYLAFSFYPKITYVKIEYGLAAIALFAVLCALPIIFEIKEGIKWKYYVSKI